ncbi:alkaline phosphatase [Pacificimonas sp. ICDLI1SI03]
MFRLLAALALCATPVAAQEKPKNVIVMIADGAGYNMLAATRMWTGAKLFADGGEWQRASLATYALRNGPEGEGQDPDLVYTSEKAWDVRPLSGDSECATGYAAGFAGYEWHRCTHPDSANTMSAMVTGTRTYNGAVNVDGSGTPELSAAETAKATGRRVGSITTVPFSHATPAAGGGAHNVSRNNYHEIAAEMLESPTLDFIAGGGHPNFDSDGEPVGEGAAAAERFRWLSSESWSALNDGSSGWTLIQTRDEIDDLGRYGGDDRVIVLPPVAAAMQVERAAAEGHDPKTDAPGEAKLLTTVPSLTELAEAAMTHLDQERGFFLSIEGGAVDWAMHANMLGRAIEEYEDFDAAVAAVAAWLDDPATPASWENTLVIVTADHDHLLFGPDVDEPFQPLEWHGAGAMPGYRWWSNSHSAQLVPFFARGAGADRLITEADEVDQMRSADGTARGRGRYLTQPEMGAAILELLSR